MEKITRVTELGEYSLFHEDCLETCRRLPDSSVDLIYVDPPFFSNRTYQIGNYHYEDKWNGLCEYLDWIEQRLLEFKRIMKYTASIYIHCDWHSSHNLKVLAYDIFERSNFLNE